MFPTRYIVRVFFLIFILFGNVTQAQNNIINGDDFSVELKTIGNYAIIYLEPKNEAIVYWRNPGELGLPTKFDLSKSTNIENYKVYWPTPKILKKAEVSSYVYDEKTNFVIELLPIESNKDVNLNLEMKFSICQRTCQNIDITMSEVIKSSSYVSTASGEVLESLAKMPKTNGNGELNITHVYQERIDSKNWLNIKFTSPKQIIEPIIYIDFPEYVSFDPSKFDVISQESFQIIRLPFTMINQKNKQIDDEIYINLASDYGDVIEFTTIPENNTESGPSLIWIMCCAFIGGLILNIMPCVLPILALKVFQVMKLSSQDSSLLKKSFVAQSVGILFSFLVFAIVTYILQFLGYKVGLGMHFQQPFYLITMAIILSMLATCLVLDINFSIILPNFISRFLNKSTTNFNLVSSFVSGALTTLLAIPCTAPFVTIAVGFALTADFFSMITVFTSMGIGMSAPFILLAIYPELAKFLPKPGNWMNSFKKLIGILIFITCLWLLYILYTQLGLRAAVIIFLLIILMKFVIAENDILNSTSKPFILVFLISLSYFLPQNIYSDNVIHENSIEQTWQEYKPDEIEGLINENYIVVVDVSASWCATCSLNKFTTLSNSSVLSTMKKFKLIAMRADISKYTPNEVANLMKLKRHRGIPLTLIYSKKNPEGIVLPTILTPHGFISAIKAELGLNN